MRIERCSCSVGAPLPSPLSRLLALPLLLLLQAGVAAGGEPCDPGWAFDAGARCVRRSDDTGPWGPDVCEALRPGAVMYAMENAQMQENLGGFADKYGEFWVGMRDSSVREGWVWTNPVGANTPVAPTTWPPSRPYVESGADCGVIGGGLASGPKQCNYPTPAFPDGAPVMCEAQCEEELPYVCSYLSQSGVGCNAPDWLFEPATLTCYKLFPNATKFVTASCKNVGGDPQAELATLHDLVEAKAVRSLLDSVVVAWVGARQNVATPPLPKWGWINSLPFTAYVPKWFAHRDTSKHGTCAFIAGSLPQQNITTNCSANTGELCAANCDAEYRHMCQYQADASMRPWPPEVYEPPISPPTPTGTTTYTLTATFSESVSVSNSTSETVSLSQTATRTRSKTPPITQTRVELEDEGVGLWWLGVLLPLICILSLLAYWYWRRRSDTFDWKKMRELEQTLPVNREPTAPPSEPSEHESDPSDTDTASSSSHEQTSPATFRDVLSRPPPRTGLSQRLAQPAQQPDGPTITYVAPGDAHRSRHVAPPRLARGGGVGSVGSGYSPLQREYAPEPAAAAEDPFLMDWRPKVQMLMKRHDVSASQALRLLREHGGDEGRASLALEADDEEMGGVESDRRSV
eukprot:Rhum_TRINITY_DN4203_c0_g1::Rhum_TRINITY_DN4203_c0_g1_i1::g.13377::m.13377